MMMARIVALNVFICSASNRHLLSLDGRGWR
jgi:hypothetical protein